MGGKSSDRFNILLISVHLSLKIFHLLIDFIKIKVLILMGLISLLNALPFGTEQQRTSLKLFKGSSILDEVPLIDSHNDLPYNLYKLENNQLSEFNLDSNLKANPKWQVSTSFTDLPRLRTGKLGGQFWVAYVTCDRNYKDAVERTIEQIDIIKRLVKDFFEVSAFE